MAAEFTQLVTTNMHIAAAVRTAMQAQGMTRCEDFLDYDDHLMKSLVKRMISPGGTVPGGRGGGGPRANRGTPVTFTQEQSLRRICFYVKYQERIQRPLVVATATAPRLKSLWDDRFELENPYKETNKEDIKNPALLTKVDEVRQMIEDLDHVLTNRLGKGGSPLAYITRAVVDLPEVTPGDADPGFGLPSRHAELVRRTRHEGPDYRADNKTVWAIIRQITHGGPGWNWVTRFSRTEDGRGAYIAIKTHYFGESFVTRTVTRADATIESLYFDGKGRNYTFEKFCEQLNRAYADLDENGEPLTEAKKVRRFLQSVKDPRLEAAKNTIMVTATLRDNLTGAMSHMADALDMSKTTTKTRTISATQTGGRGGRGGRGRGRGGRAGRGGRSGRGRGGRGRGRGRGGSGTSAFDHSNPGRSYSPAEWRTLSPDEMAKCRAARAAADTSGGARPRTAGALGTNPNEADAAPAPASSRNGPGITRGRNG